MSKAEPVIRAKIIGQHQAYKINRKRYLPCLNENPQVATYQGANMLNKLTKVMSKCIQRSKYA